jgi:hypothetical protein
MGMSNDIHKSLPQYVVKVLLNDFRRAESLRFGFQNDSQPHAIPQKL